MSDKPDIAYIKFSQDNLTLELSKLPSFKERFGL